MKKFPFQARVRDTQTRQTIAALLVFAFVAPNTAKACSELVNGMKRYSAGLEHRVRLKAGDEFWADYNCSFCNHWTTMAPRKDGTVRCTSCSAPHSGEPWREPRTVRKGPNELYLVVGAKDVAVVLADHKNQRYVNKGRKWICGSCESTNFQTRARCGGCGQDWSKTDTYFIEAPLPSNTKSVDYAALKDSKTIALERHMRKEANRQKPKFTRSEKRKQEREERYGRRPVEREDMDLNDFSDRSPKAVRERWYQRAVQFVTDKWQSPWYRRSVLVSAGIAFAASAYMGIEWALHTHQVEGALTGKNGQYSVKYESHTGEAKILEVKLAEGQKLEFPVRAEGEDVILHFTTLSGLKGVERLNGEIFIPAEE